jgi:hypothetical protein
VDPVPDPLLLRESGSAGESNPGLVGVQPGTLTTLTTDAVSHEALAIHLPHTASLL